MIGADKLRDQLKIAKDKKILFVPLQRPSDTVIKYFSGYVDDMGDFIDQIIEAKNALSDEWIVLVKKHPLEIKKPQSDKLYYVDDDTHFKDLLDICDAVSLINSGIGVTAMMYQKPVYYFGETFYGHPEINQQVSSFVQLVEHLKAGKFTVNLEKVKRFISYLTEEFYSFGTFHTKERKERDGSIRTVTTKIDFSQVKNIPLRLDFDTLMVTDVKFWLHSVGNEARIYQLILALQKELRVIVFFIGSISKDDRLRLKESALDILVKSSKDTPESKAQGNIVPPTENATLRRFYSKKIIKKFKYFISRIYYKSVIIEYIKFDYLFPFLDEKACRIIDTHDLFCQRTISYRENNDVNSIEISEDEELGILKKYDFIVSIQNNEKKFLDTKISRKKTLWYLILCQVKILLLKPRIICA